MPNNTSAAFIEALRAKLTIVVAAAPSYATVAVVIVPEGTSKLDETISLIRPPRTGGIANPAGSAKGTQDWAAVGKLRRRDEFTIQSALWVKATGKADGISTTFRSAMDRASGLLDLIIQTIRDNAGAGGKLDVGDQTIQARATNYDYRPARIPEGWVVICDFDIVVQVRVS